MSVYSASQLIASTHSIFLLKKDAGTVVVEFANNSAIDSLLMHLRSGAPHPGKNLSLHFESLKGNDPLPSIDIYLNLENENVPEEKNYVGSMGLYGLPESSMQSSEHDGAGQDRVFDVSNVFTTVRHQSNWSNKQFKLTFIPSRSLPVNTSLSIGRITLYFHES